MSQSAPFKTSSTTSRSKPMPINTCTDSSCSPVRCAAGDPAGAPAGAGEGDALDAFDAFDACDPDGTGEAAGSGAGEGVACRCCAGEGADGSSSRPPAKSASMACATFQFASSRARSAWSRGKPISSRDSSSRCCDSVKPSSTRISGKASMATSAEVGDLGTSSGSAMPPPAGESWGADLPSACAATQPWQRSKLQASQAHMLVPSGCSLAQPSHTKPASCVWCLCKGWPKVQVPSVSASRSSPWAPWWPPSTSSSSGPSLAAVYVTSSVVRGSKSQPKVRFSASRGAHFSSRASSSTAGPVSSSCSATATTTFTQLPPSSSSPLGVVSP
mmetsp:Transcript_66701/g.217089  ORF Transcript_66701/g.217089 Transcript_66701/m.217089 type:complete len:330 (-) Transcript_66701:2337-3326(-)